MAIETAVRVDRKTRLPLDGPRRDAARTYGRRASAVLGLAATFVALGSLYLTYRVMFSFLPYYLQPLPVLVAGVSVYTVQRWRNHRDIPAALDQVAGVFLLVLLWPAVIQSRLYPRVFPKQYRRVMLVGRKGRLVRAVDWRTRGDDAVGTLRPSVLTMVSMLPAIAMGRVRFRGRPLVRLKHFCRSGPVLLSEFGRAPGLWPAYTRHSETYSDIYAGRLSTLWDQMVDRSCKADRHSFIVLVRATARMVRKEDAKAANPKMENARVLVSFVVSADQEVELRRKIRREMGGADDVLVGRGDRIAAVIAAAWDAWGQDEGPAEEPPTDRDRKPSAPQTAHRGREKGRA